MSHFKAVGGNKKMQKQECLLPEEKHWASREASRESLEHYKLIKRLGYRLDKLGNYSDESDGTEFFFFS